MSRTARRSRHLYGDMRELSKAGEYALGARPGEHQAAQPEQRADKSTSTGSPGPSASTSTSRTAIFVTDALSRLVVYRKDSDYQGAAAVGTRPYSGR